MNFLHVVALLLGLVLGVGIAISVRRVRSTPRRAVGRILFPFTGGSVSRRAVDSALRLARAEDAALVPAYLASIPLQRELEVPLPVTCEDALPLLEAIEQRAARFDVEVDARIERGRTPRDALRRLLEVEAFDRVVVPASDRSEAGFGPADVAWILENVSSEVIVFRSAHEDEPVLAGAAIPDRA